MASPSDYGYLHRTTLRWKDNDVYGHVNNVEYYSFFDTVINEYLIVEAGLDIHTGSTIGLCAESHCKFAAPVAFPDTVTAGLRVTRVGNSSVRYELALFDGGGAQLAEGWFVHVFVDRDTRRPEPDPARDASQARGDRAVSSVRAAVLREMGLPAPYAVSRPLRITNLIIDDPGQGELLIDVRAAGLCHSDLSVIDGSRPRVMPMVLGHEAAGEVVQIGAGVTDFVPGDHVVLAFVPACGDCTPCRRGRPALCELGAAANTAGTLLTGAHRFTDPITGEQPHHHLGVSAFADRIVVSARSAVKIDPAIPFELAALFGCAVLTGAGAVWNATTIEQGDTVAVFGLGGVGLAAVMAAIDAGATVIAIDRVHGKLELARELGAAHTLLASDDVANQVRQLTAGGVDHALETVGSATVLHHAYAATRRGGTTVAVGLPDPAQNLSIQAVLLVTEERTLKGSYLGSSLPSRDIPLFIERYLAGRLPVERLLTHRLDIDQLNEGFDRLASGEAVRQVLVF